MASRTAIAASIVLGTLALLRAAEMDVVDVWDSVDYFNVKNAEGAGGVDAVAGFDTFTFLSDHTVATSFFIPSGPGAWSFKSSKNEWNADLSAPAEVFIASEFGPNAVVKSMGLRHIQMTDEAIHGALKGKWTNKADGHKFTTKLSGAFAALPD